LTRVELSDGAVQQFEHDRLGRLVARIDPAGNRQRRSYDILGRVVRIEEPDGNTRELEHDAQSNVTRARDAQHDVRFAYSGMNRLASRREAGTTLRFEYDTEEQLIGITNEHGHVYRFELGPTGQVSVYKAARRRNPARWSSDIRAWQAPSAVILNPEKDPVLKPTNNTVAA
jgi:YD repeat-containing protein